MDEEIPYNELLVDVEDGIVVGLYHYLWLKDGKGRACPEVNIPHTIIISNGRPKVWYFTSGKEHCIKRKHRANINNATITEALAPRSKGGDGATSSPEASSSGGYTWGANTNANSHSPSSPKPQQQRQKQDPRQRQDLADRQGRKAGQQAAAGTAADGKVNGSSPGGGVENGRVLDGTSTGNALGPWPHHGVVARFQGSMTMPQSPTQISMSGRGASLGKKKKGAQFELQEESVEFFSREQLSEMLPPTHSVVHGVAALHEGVLQRFVQPRGQHHFSIRATWSPNACVVERRTSKAKLNDPRVPLADRLAGWDGPNWLSEHTLITGTVLHGSICRLCDNVAAHLADVSGGAVRVLRMTLFFIVDDANRIWLTHCGTLKTHRLPEAAFEEGPVPGLAPLQMAAAAGRLRPGSFPPPLPTAALRLRAAPDTAGGNKGSADSGLDLPAPSPDFAASRSAAPSPFAAASAQDGGCSDGGDGPSAAGSSGRFLCVLTGEMFPLSQRCDVTYKQLLQHWFSLASQLPNEGDRLRAMDTIPLAIRRANPSLTREWYLRVRSQPTFLYRTAPVSMEAAAQITGVALEELQRTLRPPPTGHGAGGGGGGTLSGAGAPGGPVVSSSGMARPGTGTLDGSLAAGALMGGLGRNGGTRPPAAATSGRRPVTAAAGHTQLPPANGASGHVQHQRPPTRQPAGARGPVTRSKSASPSMTGQRLLPSTNSGGVPALAEPSLGSQRFAGLPFSTSVLPPQSGGGAAALPSMLVPRDRAPAAVQGGGAWGLNSVPSLLQVYGPTPEQAAEAAAAAAALPEEVIDQARDGAELDGQPDDSAANQAAAGAGAGAGAGGSPRAAAASGAAAPPGAAASGVGGSGSGGGAYVLSGPLAPTGAFPGGPPVGNWNSSVPGGNVGRPGSRRGHHMRMSASSEVTEVGSNASGSEPTSPNGTHTGLHPPHAHPPMVPAAPGGGSARMSPPRSAGVLTLHTIHEEGAVVHLPAASPAAAGSFMRPPSPLGAELVFPPPRNSGSHSVPRMRPHTRGGTDRPPAAGAGGSFSGRRYAAGGPYSASVNRGLSESGDLPQLPPGGSLNSSMGSMISRRSTNTNAQPSTMLSNDDLRTLRELSEAYTAAERLTQQLLAQAHDILSEDGSRPGSTGNSPMHAGRRQVSPPGASAGPGPSGLGATGGSGSRSSRQRADSGNAAGVSGPQGSGVGGGPAVGTRSRQSSTLSASAAAAAAASTGAGGGGGSRAGSASGRPPGVPQLPTQRPPSGASLGASPLGQGGSGGGGSGGGGSRQGSARAGGGSTDANTASDRSSQSAVQLLPPVSRGPSGSGSTQLLTLTVDGMAGGGDGGADHGEVGGAGMGAPGAAIAAAGPPGDLGLLTSAEADLLAEALQES